MTLIERFGELIDQFVDVSEELHDLTGHGRIALSFDKFGKLRLGGDVLCHKELARYMPPGTTYENNVSFTGSLTGEGERFITGSGAQLNKKVANMLRARVNMLKAQALDAEAEAQSRLNEASSLRDSARVLELHVDPHPLEALALEARDDA